MWDIGDQSLDDRLEAEHDMLKHKHESNLGKRHLQMKGKESFLMTILESKPIRANVLGNKTPRDYPSDRH